MVVPLGAAKASCPCRRAATFAPAGMRSQAHPLRQPLSPGGVVALMPVVSPLGSWYPTVVSAARVGAARISQPRRTSRTRKRLPVRRCSRVVMGRSCRAPGPATVAAVAQRRTGSSYDAPGAHASTRECGR